MFLNFMVVQQTFLNQSLVKVIWQGCELELGEQLDLKLKDRAFNKR